MLLHPRDESDDRKSLIHCAYEPSWVPLFASLSRPSCGGVRANTFGQNENVQIAGKRQPILDLHRSQDPKKVKSRTHVFCHFSPDDPELVAVVVLEVSCCEAFLLFFCCVSFMVIEGILLDLNFASS